ncbi:MAG: hypothetical protein ING19_08760, partial [Azospirillum sp.]|nr:hypothetical protein [Azospirillum sp.]
MPRVSNLVPERLKTVSVEGVWDMTADEVREILLNGDDADKNPPRKTKTIDGKIVPDETEFEYMRRISELILFVKLRRIVIRDIYPELVFKNPGIRNLEMLTRRENILEAPLRIPPIPPALTAYTTSGENGELLGRDLVQNLCNRVHEEYTGRRRLLSDAELKLRGIDPRSREALELERPRFASFSLRSVWMSTYLDAVRRNLGKASDVVKERVKTLGYELRDELEEQRRIAAERAAEERRIAEARAEAESRISDIVQQAIREGKVDKSKLDKILQTLAQSDIVGDRFAA